MGSLHSGIFMSLNCAGGVQFRAGRLIYGYLETPQLPCFDSVTQGVWVGLTKGLMTWVSLFLCVHRFIKKQALLFPGLITSARAAYLI
jgi:hypothetical protein